MMKSAKGSYLFPLMFLTLISAVCSADNPPQALPASISVPTVTPTMTPAQTRTPTPLSIFQPNETALPFPAWIKEFSDPILVGLVGRRPEFQDDFTLLNKGWFYFMAGDTRPFYAHLQYGTLWVGLSEKERDRDSMVYSPKLVRKNFVLRFDLQFEESQPEDHFRFQVEQSKDEIVIFDLYKNKMWTLHAGDLGGPSKMAGTYDYLAPERIIILIIMRGKECAIYLNNDPLAYLDDCRTGPVIRKSPSAVSFHTMAEFGHPAAVTIDNLKLWDLDRAPYYP